jgi:nondiscriminating glutamyl-tRNA synthetase
MENLNKISLTRLRFAPSPTGDLHIGGARTALFNFLLAKKEGGSFIIRVEDTDKKRSEDKFMLNQYEDIKWLGLIEDESVFRGGDFGPYKQTQRIEIYKNFYEQLLKEGNAYFCFCTIEELTKEKEEYFKREGKENYKYSRKCLRKSNNEINELLENKEAYVVRLKIDEKKKYSFKDLVRKEVIFEGKDIEDFIIVKQSGVPSYNFACVIDDHLMRISHVLRGEEHLSNTGKQIALYNYFKWQEPLFGHISIILNEERKKLSKRDAEKGQLQIIKQIRENGYLPEAVVNYILLLG